MIWALGVLGGLAALGLGSLCARIIYTGDFGPAGYFVGMRYLGLRLQADLRGGGFSGRWLFIRFRQRKLDAMSPQPEQVDATARGSAVKNAMEHKAEDSQSADAPTPSPEPDKPASKWRDFIKRKFRRAEGKPRQSADGQLLKMLWQERELWGGILRNALRMGRRDIRAHRMEHLRVSVVAASPDPMTTGVMMGWLSPLLALNRPPRRMLYIQPDFARETPSVEGSFRVSIRPIRIVFNSLRFLGGLPWRRLVGVYRKLRVTSNEFQSHSFLAPRPSFLH